MAFLYLTQNDLDLQLKPALQQQLTGGSSTLPEEAENVALAQVRSYLAGLYDVDTLYAQTGADRHPMLVQVVASIALHHLFARVNPANLPSHHRQRYDEAIAWLEAVVRGERTAGLPVRLAAGTPETDAKTGGLPRQDLSSF